MPFSPERIEFIKSCISERLESGLSNEWEVSFLTNTVGIIGQGANVRLVGFNTPETWRPSCKNELEVGQRATARLNNLVRNAQSIEFKRVACSCRAGTEGTDQCNFGRQCGSLFVEGVDVGTTLIRERLAVQYRCGATSCPRRPQVWCQ